MKKAIYGFGGHAREVTRQMEEDVTFFVDDIYARGISKLISTFDPSSFQMMVAVADSKDRQNIISRLPEETKFFSFIHSTALLMDDNISIGEGSFIGAYSILTTNIKIGNHSILNRMCQIGHDCRIGDFFSMMPGSIVGGNVQIGNQVYMGSCSNIREGIKICDNVVIGMNAAVVKDIKEPGTYVGVPAKKIK